MQDSIWLWAGFTAFILLMLAIDLGLFNRKAHAVTYRQSVIWSIVWVSLALLFTGVVYWRCSEPGVCHAPPNEAIFQYLTGYIIELSLSVDNLFVFLLLFSYFKVPAKYQHRVLFWGVLGALVMRAVMIGIGAVLIEKFHWIIYLFGAFLVYTGVKMFRQDETDVDPEHSPIVRFVRRFIPIARGYDGQKFFTRVDGKLHGTLLLLVLATVEFTDLVFAVDSIPAIFGITTDPFIVYTSNVFAILGLRTFYFLLAGVVEKFHYLKVGLAVVLTFVGVKMLTEGFVHDYVSKGTIILISLGFVVTVLVASVIASLIWPKEAETHIEVELPEGFGSPFDDDQGRLGGDERLASGAAATAVGTDAGDEQQPALKTGGSA
ncbi:MAG TPA: TerC family protein [Pyrinomonadaceae bacterium]|nr:TerC family protein [Pyrinomonadaceae bacterium]